MPLLETAAESGEAVDGHFKEQIQTEPKHYNKQHNGFLSNTFLALSHANTERANKHMGEQEAAKGLPSIATSKEVTDLGTHGDVIGHPGPGLQ